MIRKYTMGSPVTTDAVVQDIPFENMEGYPFANRTEDGKFIFSFALEDDEIVYGLGEAPRGINKRGWICRNRWHRFDPSRVLYH